jgi:hypothetical protein
MNLKHKILDASPLINASHTAGNVAPILSKVIDDYSLRDRVHVIVRDGAMAATTNLAGFDSIWCFAHILNRVIFIN